MSIETPSTALTTRRTAAAADQLVPRRCRRRGRSGPSDRGWRSAARARGRRQGRRHLPAAPPCLPGSCAHHVVVRCCRADLEPRCRCSSARPARRARRQRVGVNLFGEVAERMMVGVQLRRMAETPAGKCPRRARSAARTGSPAADARRRAAVPESDRARPCSCVGSGTERSSPFVYGLPGVANSSRVGACSKTLPAYITMMWSVMPGDDAEIVRDQDDARARLLLQLLDQFENLRLNRHVERGRRLVGDQQLRARTTSAIAIITRWRMPPENSCG